MVSVRDFLGRLSDKYWEVIGSLVGYSASIFIAAQIVKEYRTSGPGSLSPFYTAGFFLVFLFWFLYGVRFRRVAIWGTNCVAAILQFILLMIGLLK